MSTIFQFKKRMSLMGLTRTPQSSASGNLQGGACISHL